MSHRITLDKEKPLATQPHVGHNRWHPSIPPVLEVEPGEHVELEALDGMDGQVTPASTSADMATLSWARIHPLTGPVYIKGAEPGDLLEVHIDMIEPASFGLTVQLPGFGFLRDHFPEPYLVKWHMDDGYAQSEDLPGVRIKGNPFMGVVGLAPSAALLQRILAREKELLQRGGAVALPEPEGAVPPDQSIMSEALRTYAPHEVGGNLDIKQLTGGTTLLIPVSTEGGLFSCGDPHFAQGDGEVCGTAIEMQGVFHGSFTLRKGEAARRNLRDVAFTWEEKFVSPKHAMPQRFFATTGTCIGNDGCNESEDVTLAARNALINMIEHLTTTYGYSDRQAYALCSVSVSLRVSQVVDVPNLTVSAFLPLDIFV